MRISYRFPFKRKVIIDDHWVIPMQGGTLSVVEENGYAAALEVTFERQPLEYAPQLQRHTEGKAAMTITVRDPRLVFVRQQLDNAAAFLECFYDIELVTDEIETKYQGETADEEAQISIKTLETGAHNSALPLSFDMLTRAIMAAEERNAPRFEATLVVTAWKALEQQEFINSFRYSFLLIESIYGEGQFKKAALQAALKGNQEFREIVEFAIKDVIPAKTDYKSDTAKLLTAGTVVEDVIDHLVERRGFYFHGNIKRKDAWQPNDQGEAESLALLAIGIASQISSKAATLLFSPEFERRHFEDAMRAGARIVFHVHIKFRNPEEGFDRDHHIEITMPGTKPTPRAAIEVAQKCLDLFKNNRPTSALVAVKCTMNGTSQKVFDMSFAATNSAHNEL